MFGDSLHLDEGNRLYLLNTLELFPGKQLIQPIPYHSVATYNIEISHRPLKVKVQKTVTNMTSVYGPSLVGLRGPIRKAR